MTETDYLAWAKHHATVFGFVSEDDIRMLRSWYEVLGIAQPDELREATRRIAAGKYPEWPRMHLAAITSTLKVLRAEYYEVAKRSPEDDRGSCTKCNGSGRVVVPHPKSIVNGRWLPRAIASSGTPVFYECAVFCSCAMGLWFIQHNDKGLTLGQYEHHVPNWWEMVDAKVYEERAVQQHSEVPNRVSLIPALDKLIKRFKEQSKALYPIQESEE